mmetsp:Transcript_987/g.977  ORF Transcript_987/g.977 Transcript_987/m.977 type:complete len:237 (+) Transcript_987:3-713(+)
MLLLFSLISLGFASKVYCDKSHYCDSTQSCCPQANGKYGCCPFPTAICCSDQLHCCPSSLPICNAGSGKCSANNGFNLLWGTKVDAKLVLPFEFDGRNEWNSCINILNSCSQRFDITSWTLHMVGCIGTQNKYSDVCRAKENCFAMQDDGKTMVCEDMDIKIETGMIREQDSIKEQLVNNGPAMGIKIGEVKAFAIVGWKSVNEDNYWITVGEDGNNLLVKFEELFIADGGSIVKA